MWIGLYRLAQVLTRIEDMSHILVWTSKDPNTTDAEDNSSSVDWSTFISSIELPRLKMKLQPRKDSHGVLRLCALDHAGIYRCPVPLTYSMKAGL
jgi:hypothetical protein